MYPPGEGTHDMFAYEGGKAFWMQEKSFITAGNVTRIVQTVACRSQKAHCFGAAVNNFKFLLAF
jgi:hypothetical protein